MAIDLLMIIFFPHWFQKMRIITMKAVKILTMKVAKMTKTNFKLNFYSKYLFIKQLCIIIKSFKLKKVGHVR